MELIYVVEDDKSIQEIECFALSNSGYRTEGFRTAGEFYAALERELPDLVLLDIMLPDEDGLNLVKRLRAGEATVLIPILLVTARTTELDKVKVLDIGADDYMTKPFGVLELISRVKALLRRSRRTGKRCSFGAVVLEEERHAVSVEGEPVELTFKEFELLKLLLENGGRVTTREAILDRVWGTDFEGESRTLDMHIKTLRRKLGQAGTLIRTVRNVGYMLKE